jgi:hypothetical protein
MKRPVRGPHLGAVIRGTRGRQAGAVHAAPGHVASDARRRLVPVQGPLIHLADQIELPPEPRALRRCPDRGDVKQAAGPQEARVVAVVDRVLVRATQAPTPWLRRLADKKCMLRAVSGRRRTHRRSPTRRAGSAQGGAVSDEMHAPLTHLPKLGHAMILSGHTHQPATHVPQSKYARCWLSAQIDSGGGQ